MGGALIWGLCGSSEKYSVLHIIYMCTYVCICGSICIFKAAFH